jgi:hypothetical protein
LTARETAAAAACPAAGDARQLDPKCGSQPRSLLYPHAAKSLTAPETPLRLRAGFAASSAAATAEIPIFRNSFAWRSPDVPLASAGCGIACPVGIALSFDECFKRLAIRRPSSDGRKRNLCHVGNRTAARQIARRRTFKLLGDARSFCLFIRHRPSPDSCICRPSVLHAPRSRLGARGHAVPFFRAPSRVRSHFSSPVRGKVAAAKLA